jgi:hypothetical protein
MSKAAWSIRIWAIYLGALGAALLVAPNVVLRLFSVPETHAVWLRIVGMFCVFVAGLDWLAAPRELTFVFGWAAAVRFTVPIFFVTFVALHLAPRTLLLFAVPDLLGATWTTLALRADARAG